MKNENVVAEYYHLIAALIYDTERHDMTILIWCDFSPCYGGLLNVITIPISVKKSAHAKLCVK